ncbi:hypothetical protein [Streptomyces sp. KR80]
MQSVFRTGTLQKITRRNRLLLGPFATISNSPGPPTIGPSGA